jgi:hypothetical protein
MSSASVVNPMSKSAYRAKHHGTKDHSKSDIYRCFLKAEEKEIDEDVLQFIFHLPCFKPKQNKLRFDDPWGLKLVEGGETFHLKNVQEGFFRIVFYLLAHDMFVYDPVSKVIVYLFHCYKN